MRKYPELNLSFYEVPIPILMKFESPSLLYRSWYYETSLGFFESKNSKLGLKYQAILRLIGEHKIHGYLKSHFILHKFFHLSFYELIYFFEEKY